MLVLENTGIGKKWLEMKILGVTNLYSQELCGVGSCGNLTQKITRNLLITAACWLLTQNLMVGNECFPELCMFKYRNIVKLLGSNGQGAEK